jgi:hypothetical protein
VGKGDYIIENPYNNEKIVFTVNAGTNIINSYFNYTSTASSYTLLLYQLDSKYNIVTSTIDLNG